MDIGVHEITALIGPSGCGKSTVLRSPEPDERPHPRHPRRGHDRLPRHGHLRQGRRPDRGAPPDRHGLPEAEPVPEVDLRQRRLRPEGHRHEGREHGRPRRGEPARRRPVGRGQGQAQAVGLRPVRRPAAAAVHRPHHRGQARGDPHGRAVLGARPDRDRAHRGPHDRSCARTTRSSSSPTTCSRRPGSPTARPSSPPRPRRATATAPATSSSSTETTKIFSNPADPRTEDYISGRFG